MEQYTTQMDAARKGIVTKELEIVAKKERMTVEELMPLVAEGKVAICANKHHTCIDPEGVGSMLRTKIMMWRWRKFWRQSIWAHMLLWIYPLMEIQFRSAEN